MVTNEKSQLEELIIYAQEAERDDYPFEVKADDRALVLRALLAYQQAPPSSVEPTGNQARGMCQIANRPACDSYPRCQCGQTLPPVSQGGQSKHFSGNDTQAKHLNRRGDL